MGGMLQRVGLDTRKGDERTTGQTETLEMTLLNLPLRCNRRNIAVHNGQIDVAFCLTAATKLLQQARSRMLEPIYWILDEKKLTLHCCDWKNFGHDFVQMVE